LMYQNKGERLNTLIKFNLLGILSHIIAFKGLNK